MAARKQTKAQKQKVLKEISAIREKHPEMELVATEPTAVEGQYNLYFKPKGTLTVPPVLKTKFRERASTQVTYKDYLLKSMIPMAKPDITMQAPHQIYEQVKIYYRSQAVFGSYIDTLVNFTLAGFENDCQDSKIKEFYDNWCQDVRLKKVIRWMVHEFFTTGFVRTYKVLGPYEPGTNRLRKMPSPPKPVDIKQKETAAKKNKWSNKWIPIAYTVLNPTEIELKGSPLFNQTRVVFYPSEDMIELIKREDTEGALTPSEKLIIDSIPPEVKSGIKQRKEIELNPEYVGAMDYRRQPYELYPVPKGGRAFTSMDMKRAFKDAEYSTIENITSEILVITVGDKDNPVLTLDELNSVAELFDTAQKSYFVVWNHTLNVKRLPIEHVSDIFGKDKFVQTELDIAGSFGVVRAIIDGTMYGETTKEAMQMAMKGLLAEIMYARDELTEWIYEEYSHIADVYGFSRYPSIRWDDYLLKDELAQKGLIQQMVDRRIISYDTALKLLGFDPEQEKKMLEDEMPDVVKGYFGIIGSPYQKGAGGGGGGSNVQPTQRAPSGTPSSGRPSGKPSPKTPVPATPKGKIKEKLTKETKEVRETVRHAASQSPEAIEYFLSLDKDQIDSLKNLIDSISALKEEEPDD